jgi:hypothetical protein
MGIAPDETEQHAGRPVGWRVVEDRVDRPVQMQRGAGQPLVAPERPVVDRGDLAQRALRQPLLQRLALGGQIRSEVDPARQRRWDRDDHPLGLHIDPIGDHADAARSLADLPHGRAQDDALAEREPHAPHEQAGAPDEALLLSAPTRVEVALESARVALVARRRDVEEREQQ